MASNEKFMQSCVHFQFYLSSRREMEDGESDQSFQYRLVSEPEKAKLVNLIIWKSK